MGSLLAGLTMPSVLSGHTELLGTVFASGTKAPGPFSHRRPGEVPCCTLGQQRQRVELETGAQWKAQRTAGKASLPEETAAGPLAFPAHCPGASLQSVPGQAGLLERCSEDPDQHESARSFIQK